ncbi:MAG: type IV toxin-antitoxin system AbiEi family antitoxin domain-containing protein [Candidatus Melainabacteria bacterium]|nr:type IV toxin-antitoxin system AbiEi family antitoxin domain-containing protein [Candidatus Melainabacteria bacterium]
MYTSSFIKRHICRLPLDKIFSTRELLIYGSRSAVDQTMSKLVRKGIIIRLARGLFVKEGTNIEKITVYDVAKAKAESFAKQIVAWGGHLAHKLGLVSQECDKHIYCVSGSSSSFKFGDVIVRLRKACARKMHLSTDLAGQFLQALWYLGKQRLDELRGSPWLPILLRRTDREYIRLSFHLVPAWLACPFLHWRLPKAAFHHTPQEFPYH